MQKAQTTVEPVLLQQLAKALENLRYGVIELTIHDGRIVQIERREKIRAGDTQRTGKLIPRRDPDRVPRGGSRPTKTTTADRTTGGRKGNHLRRAIMTNELLEAHAGRRPVEAADDQSSPPWP
jgi:hypothetical protein